MKLAGESAKSRKASDTPPKEGGLTFGLSWRGKDEALSEAFSQMTGRPVLESGAAANSIRAQRNLLIDADNLNGLKFLVAEFSAKVGIIYIDPPYNTGNDFGYSDNFREGLRSVSKPSSECGTNSEFNAASGRRHSRWLSMMLPRLILARDLLREDGFICISIDDNELDKLRLLMSEIYGEKNFLGQITVLSNPRGRQADKHFAVVHEYLLVFAKDATKCSLAGTELTEEQAKEFKHTDESGRAYRLLGLRQRGAASLREDRPALHYPVFVDPSTRKVSLEQDSVYSATAWPKKSGGEAGRWMWSKQKLRASLNAAEAKLITHRNEWDIFIRDYLSNDAGCTRTRKVSTIWSDAELNYQNGKRELKSLIGEAPVDYPKPVALIKKVIKLLNDPNAIVLDFFAGTGTTAQAVMEANNEDNGNRSFLLVQYPEPLENERFPTISALCAERVARAAIKIFGPNATKERTFQVVRFES